MSSSQTTSCESIAHGHELARLGGNPTTCLADVDAIVEHIATNTQGGDVVCVFSNGGIGGIHGKLLERLKFRK